MRVTIDFDMFSTVRQNKNHRAATNDYFHYQLVYYLINPIVHKMLITICQAGSDFRTHSLYSYCQK